MRRTLGILAALPVVLLALWCGLALGFRLAGPTVIRHGAGGLFVLTVLATLLAVHPMRRKLGTLALLFAVFAGWYATVRPSNDRDWSPEVARPPTAEVRGDTLLVRNVRNFDYRSETDFTERWEERTYDLAAIEGADCSSPTGARRRSRTPSSAGTSQTRRRSRSRSRPARSAASSTRRSAASSASTSCTTSPPTSAT